jgi:transcriptional regulator with XRE-family HTH domain
MDDDLWPGIAERITEARDGAGLDQTELGEAIGLSKGAIGNYERGDRTPSLAALHQIAKATGRDIHWLISGATYQDPLDRIEKKLDQVLAQLGPTRKTLTELYEASIRPTPAKPDVVPEKQRKPQAPPAA